MEPKRIKKEEFEKLYNSMTVQELADKFEVSVKTIYRKINKAGIPVKQKEKLIIVDDDGLET